MDGLNDCWPNMLTVYGRQTCEIPQAVRPIRNIPDADQDPYVWFEKNMKFTPREAACLMGNYRLERFAIGRHSNYMSRKQLISMNKKRIIISLISRKYVR